MSLIDNVREAASKEGLGNEVYFRPLYKTGFDLVDYRLGRQDVPTESLQTGLPSGQLTLLVGPSGSAKTTFAIQAAWNIVKDFDEGLIIHEDFEGGTDLTRIGNLTGATAEELQRKYLLQGEGISAESFLRLVAEVADMKIKDRSKYEYDTGFKYPNGDPIKKMVPTIFIIDSIPTMFSEDITSDLKTGNGMDVTKQAKINNQIIRRLEGSGIMEKANIMIFAINHVTQKIEINPYAKSTKSVNWLKDGESLPGKQVMVSM